MNQLGMNINPIDWYILVQVYSNPLILNQQGCLVATTHQLMHEPSCVHDVTEHHIASHMASHSQENDENEYEIVWDSMR